MSDFCAIRTGVLSRTGARGTTGSRRQNRRHRPGATQAGCTVSHTKRSDSAQPPTGRAHGPPPATVRERHHYRAPAPASSPLLSSRQALPRRVCDPARRTAWFSIL